VTGHKVGQVERQVDCGVKVREMLALGTQVYPSRFVIMEEKRLHNVSSPYP
jgi:hypothetical protein